MIEGAITKLPKPDKPFAVKFGWFRESLSKQARLLREASAVGKVVALELNDVDPLTLAVVATTPLFTVVFTRLAAFLWPGYIVPEALDSLSLTGAGVVVLGCILMALRK